MGKNTFAYRLTVATINAKYHHCFVLLLFGVSYIRKLFFLYLVSFRQHQILFHLYNVYKPFIVTFRDFFLIFYLKNCETTGEKNGKMDGSFTFAKASYLVLYVFFYH